MAEILGIGATHYPPGLVPEELKPWPLARRLHNDPRIPERMRDSTNWPEPMRTKFNPALIPVRRARAPGASANELAERALGLMFMPTPSSQEKPAIGAGRERDQRVNKCSKRLTC